MEIEEDAGNVSLVDLTDEDGQKMDDDLDYALAYCLQTDFEEDFMDNSPSVEQSWNAKNKQNFKRNTEEDPDYLLALQLQNEFAEEVEVSNKQPFISNGKPKSSNQNTNILRQKGGKLPASIVDPEWEVLDPIPDIHSLFLQFNAEYFWGRLQGVEVRWSPRMTLCAGVCCYEGRGGLCSVRLSQPLLKYRPRKDLVETLLHEMIHAYLFVTHNNRDHGAHGPEFLKHMYRLNKLTGTKISVYHSFHDEVDLHRKHWWKCNGPCQRRSPFFGLVKRAMNRAPSPQDPWWAQHQATCGGTYIKVKGPEGKAQKKNLKQEKDADAKPGAGDIRNFFGKNSTPNKGNLNSTGSSFSQSSVSDVHTISSPDKGSQVTLNFVPFSGKGYSLGSSASGSRNFDSLLGRGGNLPSLNRAPKIPSIRAISSEIKGTRNPVHRKSPLPSAAKGKYLGSSNGTNSTNKTGASGGALKFGSGSGSKTVVIPKNTKTKDPVGETSNKPSTVSFEGKGFSLGGSAITSEVKSSRNVLISPTAGTSHVKRESSDRDSFDSIFPKLPSSKIIKSERKEQPALKALGGGTQTKLKFSSASSDGTKYGDICSGSVSAADMEKWVKCPVCGSMVKETTINDHLDVCL